MIQSLRIKNFETHVDTFLKLHKGVNVIIGESDEGKSGIIRAIKWNTKNRPQGDSYRNDQLKDNKTSVIVDIKYSENDIIRRERNNKNNHYKINNGEPLRALRTDVPQEVQDIAKIKDVNIQGQHPTEQYFLLADKPGQVAKKFNEVAGLTIMDKAMSDINSQVRSCNAEINVAKKEIETRGNDLKDSEWILKADKFAKKLKKDKIKLSTMQNEALDISQKINDIANISQKLVNYKDIGKAKAKVTSLILQKKQIKDKKDTQNSIEQLIFATTDVNKNLNSIIDTEIVQSALNELKTVEKEIMIKEDLFERLTDLILDIDDNESEIKKAELEYAFVLEEYETIRVEQECPTCGRKGKIITNTKRG